MKRTFAVLVMVLCLSVLVAEAANPPAQGDGNAVILYYFHRTQRCSGCRNAETRTFEAAKEAFAVQIDKGLLVLKSVAVDGSDDERKLAAEFGAFGPSVFIAYTTGGKPARVGLDRMWEKLREGADSYKTYVIENVRKTLP